MIALRFVYVLALSLWFGGTIIIGIVDAPAASTQVHRFFLLSYSSGAVLLLSLAAMGLLGPRPSAFAARFGVAIVMFAATLYAGWQLHGRSSRDRHIPRCVSEDDRRP